MEIFSLMAYNSHVFTNNVCLFTRNGTFWIRYDIFFSLPWINFMNLSIKLHFVKCVIDNKVFKTKILFLIIFFSLIDRKWKTIIKNLLSLTILFESYYHLKVLKNLLMLYLSKNMGCSRNKGIPMKITKFI